ncbi:site-specific DNA-methyltransferase [Rathayibacter sp. AY1D3]|nr:site-specific DNA-methyltransferase [Rathayibacter sp. AY1A5]PPH90565.1 site-specific DNA-methyltransferase [Rathayibacter sp. AY1D3]
MIDGRIDLDVLRTLLGDAAEAPGTETSGLRWVGMAEARQLSTLPATGTLLPRPDESVHWDDTSNIVIEGDNLEVLRLLRRGYTNKVDVVYIDPPYNTGNDFVYDDKRMSTIAEHETDAGLRDEVGVTQVGVESDRAEERRLASARHAKWLSMIYPRLLVAHSLLKETGVLIAAIDDTEHARFKLLLDRVFGAENFAANVVWQGGSKNDARFTSGGLDYMLIYAKNRGLLEANDTRWIEPKKGHDIASAAATNAWEKSGHQSRKATELFRQELRKLRDILEPAVFRYDQIDEQGRAFQPDNLTKPSATSKSRYDVIHPATGNPVRMPEAGWRLNPERMASDIKSGRILFGPDENTVPRYKRFLAEMNTQAIKPVFTKERASASYALAKLLGEGIFPYSKDTEILGTWISAVSESNPNALVLDFFAGSGSTGHAVMNLNAADGGNRRYILVQLDEPVAAGGYDTIADITRERLRRAGTIIAENPTFESASVDLGFRSYRLASSNLRAWDGTGELSLLDAVDNLVDGRTTDDLLVEMMLRLGIELNTPVETREIAGSTLYNLGRGTLYAFFGEDVTTARATEIGRALVRWRSENPVDTDVTLVVRDTGFVDSSAKLNLDAAIKQAGFTTFRSI